MVANLLGKRQGAVGLAYERVADTAEVLPVYVLPCDSANIEVTPVTYERTNNLDENSIGVEQSGFEYSFTVSGMEVDNETLGYIAWLFLGAEDNTTPGTHIITPQFVSNEFTFFKDHGGMVYHDGTGNRRTEVLQGCKITEFSIEQPHKGYAKVSLSGWGKSKSWIATALTRALNFGANNVAVHWNAAVDDATPFRFALNEAGFVSYLPNPTSYKVSMTRELTRAGMNLATDDARGLVEGARTCETEFTMDMAGQAAAVSTGVDLVLGAIEDADRIALEYNWKMSTDRLSVLIPTSRITNSPKGELGTGTDPQQITVQAKAFRYSDSNKLITITSLTPNALTDYYQRAGA